MNGFTDIHTHILPGVDDGAKDMAEACRLVRLAWQDGTRTLFLTPHYRGAYRENTKADLQRSFSELCRSVAEELPDMKLYLGCEFYSETDAAEKLLSGEILTMNDSRYVLLEFWSSTPRLQIITGVSQLVHCGYTPIIAHAERYDIFRLDPTLTAEVLSMGALIQLNTRGIMGEKGFGIKRFCHKLLKAGQAHFVASDAHDDIKRPPVLHKCFLRVSKKYGQEYAKQLFYENAQAVIENRSL